MNETYAAAHTESAIDLYELRLNWLDETDIHAGAFEGVEERLCASVYHCARALCVDEPGKQSEPAEENKEPTTEAECLVFLASHINASQPAIHSAGYDLAYQWLTLETAKSAAAEAALSLYPDLEPARLLKLYGEQEALRPVLFRIFRKQMRVLPSAFVKTALTSESSSVELKIEVLNYASANGDFGLDIFRPHYLPLLAGKAKFDAGLAEAAIWGGMVRNDPDASHAISKVVASVKSGTDRTRLLRLAALSGAEEFLPLLLQAAESDPDTGYPLLVLFGHKSVMPELLKALEKAHSMEAAAIAFNQLSDQILPRIPRLSVVGEEEADDLEEDARHIPDIKVARAWWDKHQARWKADERWLFGIPATPAHLAAMSKKYAGSFGRDLLALLALTRKTPLNIPSEIWRVRQQQLLAEKMAAQPEAKPVRPVKARHA